MRRSPASELTEDAARHLSRLLAELEGSSGGSRIPLLDWALKVPEPKRGPLDFSRFPFQEELYSLGAEEHEVVIKKATQVGISAFCLRWAIYWADVAGLSALYVFPHQRQLADFSVARIAAAIQLSPYLRSRVREAPVQNNTLKAIGNGLLYLRGSESVADLQSVDADVLVLDEYDFLVAANIPDAERRIGASDYSLIRRVGVPSLPGFGISELYAQSDRRQWHVRCECCHDRQPLTFADNVDTERLIRVCRKCRQPLDVGRGEWVAEFPDQPIRGYHVPRLIVPDVNLGSVVRASRATGTPAREAFYNKDLAEEWAPEDARLTAGLIEAAQRDYEQSCAYSGGGLVTMGVDVASVRNFHVRMSLHLDDGRKLALFLGEVAGFEELAALMDAYSVHMCAIDAQPERLSALGFAQRFAGRVYLVSYTASLGAQQISIDDDRRHVTASRVDAIDAAFHQIRSQRNLLPRCLPPDYVRHLQAVVRSVENDEFGRVQVRYRSVGPDDYLHAETYDHVARQLCEYRHLVRVLSEPVYYQLDEEELGFRRSRLSDYGPAPEPYFGPPEPTLEELLNG